MRDAAGLLPQLRGQIFCIGWHGDIDTCACAVRYGLEPVWCGHLVLHLVCGLEDGVRALVGDERRFQVLLASASSMSIISRSWGAALFCCGIEP